MPRYRYAREDGRPLRACPHCGDDLTAADGGVLLVLSVAGRTVETSSSLAPDGALLDTEDDAVANGYHSGTYCGCCGEPLTDWEDDVGE
jgi:hypothetical protein